MFIRSHYLSQTCFAFIYAQACLRAIVKIIQFIVIKGALAKCAGTRSQRCFEAADDGRVLDIHCMHRCIIFRGHGALVCLNVFMYLYTYVCIFVCVYIYIYIYTNTHIYVCTSVLRFKAARVLLLTKLYVSTCLFPRSEKSHLVISASEFLIFVVKVLLDKREEIRIVATIIHGDRTCEGVPRVFPARIPQ
jgi:hypothetical protein